MDKDLEKYFENYFDLFSRPGWKQFEEEISDALEDLRLALETTDQPIVVQGQVKELRFFNNFRTMIENSYEAKKEEDLEVLQEK